MSNAKYIINYLIVNMRNGREPDAILKDDILVDQFVSDDTSITMQEAVDIATHVVNDLYDGRFPIDHLEVGDICIDAFGMNPCIITQLGRSIHVMYFTGKTFKFKRSQERFFKKTGRNVSFGLESLLEKAKERYLDAVELGEIEK